MVHFQSAQFGSHLLTCYCSRKWPIIKLSIIIIIIIINNNNNNNNNTPCSLLFANLSCNSIYCLALLTDFTCKNMWINIGGRIRAIKNRIDPTLSFNLHDKGCQRIDMHSKNNVLTYEERIALFSIVARIRAGQPGKGGSICCRDKRFLTFPRRSHSLWDTPSHLFNGYEGPFCRGKASAVSPTTHVHNSAAFKKILWKWYNRISVNVKVTND